MQSWNFLFYFKHQAHLPGLQLFLRRRKSTVFPVRKPSDPSTCQRFVLHLCAVLICLPFKTQLPVEVLGVPVLLFRCLVVRAFNQRKRKPGLVSSSAGGAKSLGKCPLQPCWLPSNEGDEVFEPLGLGWPPFLGTCPEKGSFLHVTSF